MTSTTAHFTENTVVKGAATHLVAYPGISKMDHEWMRTFHAYLQQHLSNPYLCVPQLAAHFAMSESTLLRQLKRLTGRSPVRYMQDLRLAYAKRLLDDEQCRTISQVSAAVGYRDSRSFSRLYKKRFGKLPSES